MPIQKQPMACNFFALSNTFFEIKNKLTRNSGIEPLFNHSQFRKNLESIYTDMYTHYLTDGNND